MSESNILYCLCRSANSININKNISIIEADLNSPKLTEILPADVNIVIHLAQSSSYRNFPNGARDMFDVNLSSTFSLLEWARNNGVSKFIFTSTANVYDQNDEKLFENSKTFPNSFYGASKLAAEQLISQYSNYFSIEILRLFTVYGPNQKNMLIPNIIENIKSYREIQLASSVGIMLTPIYVDDLVEIICKLVHFNKTDVLSVQNICGDESVSLSKIVNIIEEFLKIDSIIKITNAKPLSFIGSNKTLLSNIGQYKFTNIEDGLLKTLKL
jgi:UDP-glucose 4-epimerase